MKNLLLLLFVPLLPSCLTTGGSVPSGVKPPEIKPAASIVLQPSGADWSSMADVAKAVKGKPVTVSGKTLDLKGCQLVGTKLKKYPDKQDERNQPLRVNIDGFTLKNGSVRAIPGGVLFRGEDNVYSKLTFLDIGEDALSNVKNDAVDATITGCKFYGATDKSIQANCAEGLTLTGNYVTGGVTAVRLQESTSKAKNPRTKRVSGNTFENVRTAFNLSGGIRVEASGNTYKNVGEKWVTNNGASYTEK